MIDYSEGRDINAEWRAARLEELTRRAAQEAAEAERRRAESATMTRNANVTPEMERRDWHMWRRQVKQAAHCLPL